MAPVRVAHALRLPIIAAIAALVLSGCMQTAAPVASAPRSDLDYMAYGQPDRPAPAPAVADSGGAISALHASFAGGPRNAYAAAPAVYAAAPMPVAHDP